MSSFLQQCFLESAELLAGVAATPLIPSCCTGIEDVQSPESKHPKCGQNGCSTRTPFPLHFVLPKEK